ncbi:hypothetical protein XENOCAPTIV_023276, partial [Xenoophorus captivus]
MVTLASLKMAAAGLELRLDQTRFRASRFTQTEPQEQINQQEDFNGPDPPGLMDFLKRVEDLLIKELVKNSRSHAFDGFQSNWEERSQH